MDPRAPAVPMLLKINSIVINILNISVSNII